MSKKRRNGCDGKVKHASRDAAMVTRRRTGISSLVAYQCRHCGGWHLGNSNKPHKIAARIDQLLFDNLAAIKK